MSSCLRLLALLKVQIYSGLEKTSSLAKDFSQLYDLELVNYNTNLCYFGIQQVVKILKASNDSAYSIFL